MWIVEDKILPLLVESAVAERKPVLDVLALQELLIWWGVSALTHSVHGEESFMLLEEASRVSIELENILGGQLVCFLFESWVLFWVDCLPYFGANWYVGMDSETRPKTGQGCQTVNQIDLISLTLQGKFFPWTQVEMFPSRFRKLDFQKMGEK